MPFSQGFLIPLAIFSVAVFSCFDAIAAEQTTGANLRNENVLDTSSLSSASTNVGTSTDVLRVVLRSCALVGMIGGVIGAASCQVRRLANTKGHKKNHFLEGLDVMSLKVAVIKLFSNIFFLYGCFLLMLVSVYYCVMGSFKYVGIDVLVDLSGSAMESLGLLILRHKISKRRSARGISGECMCTFLVAYILRLYQLLPEELGRPYANRWALWAFCFVSLLQVVDIVKAVFVTYRNTYQDELDVLKTKHVLLGVTIASFLVHPSFEQGFLYSWVWTLTFYADVSGLIPQVVMMAQGAGKVEAPISHFVAATALSRTVDLYFWWESHEMGPQGYILGFNYSGWLIVLVHFLNLVLVADFLYYYMKARVSGSALSDDLALPI